jgi:hypothetical protein
MRCHRVRVRNTIRFAKTATEAVHLRGELCAEKGLKKKPEQMAVVDIPSDKAGIVAYLNKLMIGIETHELE